MSQSPAFQFYPTDFVGDGKVGTMTLEEVGAYTLLLCLDWNQDGFQYDERKLARWCRVNPRRFSMLWQTIAVHFDKSATDGRLRNPRLVKERAKQLEWKEKSSAGGKKSAAQRAKGGARVVEPPYQPTTQPNGNTLSPTPVTATATEPADTTRQRVSRGVRPAAKYPHFRVEDSETIRERWARFGAFDRSVIRKAFGPLFGEQPTYAMADLLDAIDAAIDDAKEQGGFTFRTLHPVSFVQRVGYWVAWVREPNEIEGELTPKGRKLLGIAA